MAVPERKWPLEITSDTIFNADALTDVQEIPIPSARDCAFAPEGNRLAVVTQKGLVLWDIPKSEIVWETTNSAISQLDFSPDGSLVATCDSNRKVEILNVADRSIRFKSTNHRAAVKLISFSPDGRLLVTGDQIGTIKFWHVKSGQEVLEVQYPKHRIMHFEFSEEGDQLICQLDPDDNNLPHRIVIIDGSKMSP